MILGRRRVSKSISEFQFLQHFPRKLPWGHLLINIYSIYDRYNKSSCFKCFVSFQHKELLSEPTQSHRYLIDNEKYRIYRSMESTPYMRKAKNDNWSKLNYKWGVTSPQPKARCEKSRHPAAPCLPVWLPDKRYLVLQSSTTRITFSIQKSQRC